MGLSKEQFVGDFSFFVSTIHTVMENWSHHHFTASGEFITESEKHLQKSYGEVRQAIIALDNDFHFLSVCYHQMQHSEKDETLESGIKMLYFTNLTESYFTNLRSIYDRLATFPRIVLSCEELKSDALNKDSFNALVKSCKNSKITQAAYTKDIIDMILNIDNDLQIMRQIRDPIIHHGKEPVIKFDDERLLTIKVPSVIGNYSSPNLLPDILETGNDEYPLYAYLRELTLRLLLNMEEMGNVLGHYYLQIAGTEKPLYYFGLGGLCMEIYMEFLFPNGIKTHLTPEPGIN